MTQERIIIFDTTLRDGEQSPGMSMNLEEKLLVAEVLDSMGVDVIEAGFAQASNGDFEAVKEIAGRIKNAVVCSLARAKSGDIERAAEALKNAPRFRIHTFISTSDIHLKYQFRLSREQVLEIIKDTVALARRFTDNVEWSAMDSTRSDRDYLCRAVETAIKAGATTVNIPDTVGYATPDDYGQLIKYLKDKVPNIDKAVISTHCQNDLGLATANSLAAIRNGARQIECTINGIGERAGNTALEEVVMAIKTRADMYPFACGIDTTQITRASRLVQNITGAMVQVNKAIVGANAFAHESGIHQDGVLKHAGTYEIMTPESVGLSKSSLVLGKHSGRHAFRERLNELGFEIGDNAFEEAFHKFKDLADKKKEIYDEDLIALLDTESRREDFIQLESLHITCGTVGPQTAMLTLRIDGEVRRATVEGSGPVDAAFNAIAALVPHRAALKLYQVSAITQGTDAQAEVNVRLETPDGKIVNGHGSNIDTLVASALAYINALCKLQTLQKRETLLPNASPLAAGSGKK
ncbi:MAG: 2-isopropylmalate synthase [Pseudomonadota bacterium]|nr:2-isopropylmalate synthase [Pseudomonadota bacterium]MDE3037425.1 2-isopropylmalate synthase [Pseudomonadota bacterium]